MRPLLFFPIPPQAPPYFSSFFIKQAEKIDPRQQAATALPKFKCVVWVEPAPILHPPVVKVSTVGPGRLSLPRDNGTIVFLHLQPNLEYWNLEYRGGKLP